MSHRCRRQSRDKVPGGAEDQKQTCCTRPIFYRQADMDKNNSARSEGRDITIGVLALQGAFEEHQRCMEKGTGCKTRQIRTPQDLQCVDGIIFPGGESTAMGLIGMHSGIWEALQTFSREKPTWGTCAGMILLADRCVGTSAVIENGQSLIGGMDILVCRNYFGSQISSFEMATPPPPGMTTNEESFPGVFIRAPAILTAGPSVQVLGRVSATPCKSAAVVLKELEKKIAAGENVIQLGVVDALDRQPGHVLQYMDVVKKDDAKEEEHHGHQEEYIQLPGAADGTNAREVICAARKGNILITAFHPELTTDYRWHQYFYGMVVESCKK